MALFPSTFIDDLRTRADIVQVIRDAAAAVGFIALAGIIVRNSILLVDFVRHERKPGADLREVMLKAGAIRFKPILLTALAAIGPCPSKSARRLPSRAASWSALPTATPLATTGPTGLAPAPVENAAASAA